MTDVRRPSVFDGPDGATPLDPDSQNGLLEKWVGTRGELNALEEANILRAIRWVRSRQGFQASETLLKEPSMRRLHREMFGEVWSWAGQYRKFNTNIGIEWSYIPVQVRDLVDDVRLQTADPENLPWSADEVAIRFHHRLVSIHPFPNGNGRHARLAADILIGLLGEPVFTWGGQSLNEEGDTRRRYISALQIADRTSEYEPLIDFVRS